MPLRKLRAVLARGGSCRVLLVHRWHLPAERREWEAILLGAVGGGDPGGLHLDALSGEAAAPQVCVVGPPTRSDADVDCTFAQVDLRTGTVSLDGMCVDAFAAVGPFAVDERLIAVPRNAAVTVRIHCTNTGALVRCAFVVRHGTAEVEGTASVTGVPGSGAPVRLEFTDAGSGRAAQPAAAALVRTARRLFEGDVLYLYAAPAEPTVHERQWAAGPE